MEGLSGFLSRASNLSLFRFTGGVAKLVLPIFFLQTILCCFVKDAMDDFKRVSEISINYWKNSMFTAGVGLEEQREISYMLGILKQSLPITYLGVPLITSRLNKINCIPLIEIITLGFSYGPLCPCLMLAGCN